MAKYVFEMAKAGLSPTMDEFRKVSDGSAVTPPSITALFAGSRFYTFTFSPTERHVGIVNPNDVQVSDFSFEISEFDFYVPTTFQTLLGTLVAGVLPAFTTVIDDSPVYITRGDAHPFTFNLGTGWNLTGKKAYFIVKADPKADNSTAIIEQETTITDALNGVCTYTTTTAQTGTIGEYEAEIEVRDDPGETNPQTALQFKLVIRQDVRQ